MASKIETPYEECIRNYQKWKTINKGLDFVTQNLLVETFVTGVDNGTYMLNPPHQRNVVHNDKWQSDIISSVMRGFPLGSPEFDSCIYTEGENCGLTYFRSLDGKQRLSSIYRFIKNEYIYDGDIPGLSGKRYKDWPKLCRLELERSNISITVTKQTLSDEEVTNYFNKKQNTKKTSSGESFNAVLTERADTCKKICENTAFPQKCRDTNKRFNLLEIIVRLCYVQHALNKGITNIDPNKKTLIQFLNDEDSSSDTSSFEKYSERINFIINIVASFKEKMQGPWKKTFLIPLMVLYCKYESQHENIKLFIKTKIEGNNNFYPEKVGGNHNASSKRCEFIVDEFKKFIN